MASGDPLWTLTSFNCSPPATLGAEFGTVVETSTPNAIIHTINFDGAADEHMDWHMEVPVQYSDATGFTFQYFYAMDGVDVDLVDLEFSMAKLVDTEILTDDQGLDTATPVSIPDTPVATVTADKSADSPTGALAKADGGTPVAGNYVIIRCQRDTSAAANDDDLQLVKIKVTET